MTIIDKLQAYLIEHLGDAYAWGAQGECLTDMKDPEAWLRRVETSTKNGERAVAFYRKSTKKPMFAFDCSGLIVRFLLDNGVIKGDKSSRGFYSECSKITRDQLQKGDFVFRHNGLKIHHIGVYLGAVTVGSTIFSHAVVESMGRDAGVVIRDINDSGKSYWNRYGHYDKLFADVPVGSARDLRLASPMMRGEDVKKLQTALAVLRYDVGDIDGIYGSKTDAAVRAYQAHATAVTVGMIDEETRALLGL